MTEPTIKIDGDEIYIGNFTFSDHDIAEYLDKEIEANRGVLSATRFSIEFENELTLLMGEIAAKMVSA